MVSLKSVEKQLKRIRFSHRTWNHAEAMELPDILLPDEKIFECVNGLYEGGFALLVATDVRVLLIDKKPFKFLNVEDLRFDMINEIDYSHRLMGAHISISAGNKNLKFTSYNQPRLRKLISHVQHCMAESKKEQSSQANTQQQHLEQINQQLQTYLRAQHQQQEDLRKQFSDSGGGATATKVPEPLRPDPELSDYLFAQSLLAQHQQQTKEVAKNDQQESEQAHMSDSMAARYDTSPNQNQAIDQAIDQAIPKPAAREANEPAPSVQMAELYQDGMREVFGKAKTGASANTSSSSTYANSQTDNRQSSTTQTSSTSNPASIYNSLEINPLRIAYSKLPMVLRNRAFGRHATALRSASMSAPGPAINTGNTSTQMQ